jgi:hypothetical protein
VAGWSGEAQSNAAFSGGEIRAGHETHRSRIHGHSASAILAVTERTTADRTRDVPSSLKGCAVGLDRERRVYRNLVLSADDPLTTHPGGRHEQRHDRADQYNAPNHATQLRGAGKQFFASDPLRRGEAGEEGSETWQKLRGRWEYSHVARATLALVGLIALAIAVAL